MLFEEIREYRYCLFDRSTLNTGLIANIEKFIRSLPSYPPYADTDWRDWLGSGSVKFVRNNKLFVQKFRRRYKRRILKNSLNDRSAMFFQEIWNTQFTSASIYVPVVFFLYTRILNDGNSLVYGKEECLIIETNIFSSYSYGKTFMFLYSSSIRNK